MAVGAEIFTLIGILAHIAPQLKEHNGHIPNRIPPHKNARILPVTVLGLQINVFICQINASCKTSMPVYYNVFTVIPVIHPDFQ